MATDRFSLKSRLGSFKFAFNGLRSLIKKAHNSRIHLFAATAAVAMGIFFKISLFNWSLLVIVTGIVFMAELFNSSLEELSDIIDPQLNEKIRNAKDYAAAAVLITAVISLITGGIIFIPEILDFIRATPQ